jgi:hypothetical protein
MPKKKTKTIEGKNLYIRRGHNQKTKKTGTIKVKNQKREDSKALTCAIF